MKETYYIGAYWSARLESPPACAERLLATMNAFQDCHELVARWNRQGPTLREALRRKILPSHESLERLFKAYDPEDPTEMGYWIRIWNGQRSSAQASELSVTCGCIPPVPNFGNRLVLDLPDPSDEVATLYESDVLLRILRAIVSAWEPDRALLTSYQYLEQYIYRDDYEPPAGKPNVGWMTYLRAKRLQTLAGPPPCEAVHVPDRGTIFVITRDHRFSVANPDDVERARKLTEYLELSGALVPIPPTEPF